MNPFNNTLKLIRGGSVQSGGFARIGRGHRCRQNGKTPRRVKLEALEKRILLAGDVYDVTEYAGDLGAGINGSDSRVGDGYVMFTKQSVQQRFSAHPPTFGDYADHLIAVLFENGQWKYDANYYSYAFTPEPTDVLLAAVSFSADTITDLQGTDSSVEGIPSGYADGDLAFFADRWNGTFNDGEFEVEGTYFVRNFDPSAGIARDINDVRRGVAGNDSAQGLGHILYSVENVYDRFSPGGPAYYGSADHLIGVVYQGGQWYYDDNYYLQPFSPESSDVLIAELDYPFTFQSSSGRQIALPNRIQSVGGFASFYNGNQRNLVAELSFDVIGGGESGLQVLPPRDLTNDVLLTNYDEDYRAGQVDYLPVSLTGVGAASRPSPIGGAFGEGGSPFFGPVRSPAEIQSAPKQMPPPAFANGRSMGSGDEIPWYFVELTELPQTYIDTVAGDSTPLEATEPNRVFRQTPQTETPDMSAIATDSGTRDVIYLGIQPADLPPGAPQTNPYPADFYVRVSGMSNQFYDLSDPLRVTPLYSFAGDGGQTTYFGPFSGQSDGSHLIVVDRSSPDSYEAFTKEQLDFEIVYQTPNGSYLDATGNRYSSSPQDPALQIGPQTETGCIKDDEELVSMDTSQDAIEAGPKQNGKIEITLMPTDSVIPAGLDESAAPFTWDSFDNYFETRWQLILEVDAQPIRSRKMAESSSRSIRSVLMTPCPARRCHGSMVMSMINTPAALLPFRHCVKKNS